MGSELRIIDVGNNTLQFKLGSAIRWNGWKIVGHGTLKKSATPLQMEERSYNLWMAILEVQVEKRSPAMRTENNCWTAITQLAHHGMLYVPIGYTFGAGMFKMDSIRGGSPYGAGVFSGDGTREPSDTELALAEHQGKYMAGIVKRFAKAS
ncbi:probable NAD(P)H dehydrogenase (quinone) FQR1-like 2 [Quercus lobata]|uniref:probable NAD(P)H dehydrogenase (quinone) FQR1-like 2 n=1 Tax=Quercus lobata TaxID=97700 RepID=UPI0012457790|nr:probable NAD(P)H dehydrogenase (quinone) FQR1-like 2 [Quercus lobata]